MKRLFFSSTLILAIVITGCSKNDDTPTTNGPPYEGNYKNQDVEGMINGQAWKYMRGSAYSYAQDNTHEIGLYSNMDDSCHGGTGPSVLIHLEKTDFVGVYNLGSGPQASAVNIYYFDNDYFNQYPQLGSFEIVSADTSTGIVIGKIDAQYDANNFVNGYFRIKYCAYYN